jgi:hypothetical protein
MNNAVRNILFLGVGSIDDVTSEQALLCQALLSLSASCLFLRIVDSSRLEMSVYYRNTCEHKIVYVLLYRSPSDTLRIDEEAVGTPAVTRRGFTSGMNVFVMAVRVSVTMRAEGDSQLGHVTKHGACVQCCAYSGDMSGCRIYIFLCTFYLKMVTDRGRNML